MPSNVNVRLEGWATFMLIGRDGKVKYQREGQHNLILDSGLERIATHGFEGITSHCAVGTGSTAPDVTQTELVNEIARTNSDNGIGIELTRVADGVYQRVTTRQFGFSAANGNLTEWGFAISASAGNFWNRELFRDENDDPFTLTKTEDEQLRIIYTLEIQLSPPAPQSVAIPVTNLGDGTLDASFGLVRTTQAIGVGGTYQNVDYEALDAFARANFGTSPTGTLSAIVCTGGPASFDYNTNLGNSFNWDTGTRRGPNGESYVTGSFERKASITWPSSQANSNHAGFAMGTNQNINNNQRTKPGYFVRYDEADEFEKDDLHQFSLFDITMSWARA